MRTRTCAWVVAGVLGCLQILAAPAHADPRADITAKTRAAMASYDAMDYDQARKLLYQALAIAKKARLDKDPIVARVYLDLGIAQLAGSDQDATKLALLSAAQIDPKIAIDPAYKSPELARLLDEAKAAAASIGDDPADDCRAIRGLTYALADSGRRGAAQPIEVSVGGDAAPARVVVMYRAEGALDFVETRLTRQGACKYTGSIPASAARGSLVHYYVAAYDARNRVLAAKGSSSAPNQLDLRTPGRADARPVGAPDRPPAGPMAAAIEEPATEPAAAPPEPSPAPAAPPAADDALDTSDPQRSARRKILLAVSAGTGFGYVSGRTENDNQVQSCCIGASLLVVTPELGYYFTPRLSLGLAVRLGFPIGADVADHASVAPAGFVRARYALFQAHAAYPGDGFLAMAEAGAGILRNTIKLDASVTMSTGPGMETDIVAQGPLLFGAGLGYRHHLGASLAVVVELDALAGIAVTRSFASANHLNSGISADLSLGLALGF
jgi:hypothetical protein